MFLARLVGDFVAACEIKNLSDIERKARPALARKLFTELAALHHAQLSRVWRSLCGVEFKEPELINLTDVVVRRLGTIYKLAEVRAVIIPGPSHPSSLRGK